MSAVVRGRPKSEEKKQQIFHAAVHLFLGKGFDGTSMDEVAERAGVSKQTVYSHFRSKEELFSHCIRHKCAGYRLTHDDIDPEAPVEETLRAVAHQFSDLLLSAEAVRMKRICCANAESQPELSRLYYDAGPSAMIGLLTDYIHGQARRGRLEVNDPGLAARQFLFMLQGEPHVCELMNVAGAEFEQAEIDAWVDSCVDLFLTVYRAP